MAEETKAECPDMEAVDIFSADGEGGGRGSVDGVSVAWVEKYRPSTLDDMVLNADTKAMLGAMVASGELQSMSLFGSAGIGKSTLARLLARSVGAETLFLNCGVDGTVDVVRNRIQPFCESASAGRIKCIILDEFDASSGGNAAANGMQKALRSLMEAFTDTRFIITCNYPKKIIEPIFSRCPKVHIGFTLKDVACRLKQIWDAEGVKYDRETAMEFTRRFVVPSMPDIRLIVNTAQMMCSDGTLRIKEDAKAETASNALDAFADRILDMVRKGQDYRTVRKAVAGGSQAFGGEYELLVGALMESVMRNGYSHLVIPAMADCAYRMSQVTDPSLQMVGLIVSLYGKL